MKRQLTTPILMQNPPAFRLAKIAEAKFPTELGDFRIYGFEGHFQSAAGPFKEEAAVLKMGDLSNPGPAPLMRVHSQCLTGDVFHSLRCDCRAQLEMALHKISREGRGLLIYEMQEGRGIGLMNKLRAYELQDGGLDTIEANEQLGFESDLRSYILPAQIVLYFGLKQVRLISNNPEKVEALENAGIQVVERVPCLVEPLESRQAYLATKRDRMGHFLEGL
jgi:GTP cyclohydrolase II